MRYFLSGMFFAIRNEVEKPGEPRFEIGSSQRQFGAVAMVVLDDQTRLAEDAKVMCHRRLGHLDAEAGALTPGTDWLAKQFPDNQTPNRVGESSKHHSELQMFCTWKNLFVSHWHAAPFGIALNSILPKPVAAQCNRFNLKILRGVAQTLLIPLHYYVEESKSESNSFKDEIAERFHEAIAYDWSKFDAE